ncbi:MAG: alpha/beta hydrolase family protein [Candidatus Limnocylindrales bacterium]
MSRFRRAGVVATSAAVPLALAYRFSQVYRARAGFPHRRPPVFSPADFGMPFEATTVRSAGGDLPAWFIPANGGAVGPGVALVHGWDSARDRMLGNVQFLHAAGFHCLTFDVRGHGANPAETLPISAGEYGADASAAFATLLARPEVSLGAILGHSMGAAGAILAAAADPRVAALVSSSAPSDPRRLVSETFRLAHLRLPGPISGPLSWLTTREFVRPRGHRVQDISACAAIARYRGPILLIHGELDQVIPVVHAERLRAAAVAARAGDDRAIELVLIKGGGHTWLYEDVTYRRRIAAFLARSLGGPLSPEAAADAAAGVAVSRLPEPDDESLVGDRASGLASAFLAGEPGRT